VQINHLMLAVVIAAFPVARRPRSSSATAISEVRTPMADNTTYFGDPVHATYPDGRPIVVNGRPLLIPENFDLQNEINASNYAATRSLEPTIWWFAKHYAQGSSGDPQRQAGYSGGFDPRYTDGGNYGFGLSAKAHCLAKAAVQFLAAKTMG
jgi:hypothetical protein